MNDIMINQLPDQTIITVMITIHTGVPAAVALCQIFKTLKSTD